MYLIAGKIPFLLSHTFNMTCVSIPLDRQNVCLRGGREKQRQELRRTFQKKRFWQKTTPSRSTATEGLHPKFQGRLTRTSLLSFPFGEAYIYAYVYGCLIFLKSNLPQVSSLVRQFGTKTSQGLSQFSKTSAGDAPHKRLLLSRDCYQPPAAQGRRS